MPLIRKENLEFKRLNAESLRYLIDNASMDKENIKISKVKKLSDLQLNKVIKS